MALYEIVGMSDCKFLAKAKKLAEEINRIFPMVEFKVEMLDRPHWADFCDKMQRQQGWDIKRSPVVYEVLVQHPDGKRHLIGDCNDFCEFANMYFDISYSPTTLQLLDLAKENKNRFDSGYDGRVRREGTLFTVSLVNAPLRMLELLLCQLLSPVSIFPPGVLVNIRIFDEFTDPRILSGVLMETTDLASPILYDASVCSSLFFALKETDLIIYAEDLSRAPLESPSDWINRIEVRVANLLAEVHDPKLGLHNCRIIVGGDGPQCYVAEMIRKVTPVEISGHGRVIASGQYIAQKAKAEIARVGAVPPGCISRITAWGWPGEVGAYVEVQDASVREGELSVQGPGIELPLSEVATNSDFIYRKFSKEFVRQQRDCLGQVENCPKNLMALVESIIQTLHIWLDSEAQVNPTLSSSFKCIKSTSSDSDGGLTAQEEEGEKPESTEESMEEEEEEQRLSRDSRSNKPKRSNNNNNNAISAASVTKKASLPVLNVGVLCACGSTFPDGTFMVQPAVCINGVWQPLGIISRKTHKTVVYEVNKLWLHRQRLIYRDEKIAGVFPDWDEMITEKLIDVPWVGEFDFSELPVYESYNKGEATEEIHGEAASASIVKESELMLTEQ